MIRTASLPSKIARRSAEPNNPAGDSVSPLTKINLPSMLPNVLLNRDVFQVTLNLLLPNLLLRTVSNNIAQHNLKSVEKILDALEHSNIVTNNVNLIFPAGTTALLNLEMKQLKLSGSVLLTMIASTKSKKSKTLRLALSQSVQLLSLIHISEPTRPLYISYAVFCLKKKK